MARILILCTAQALAHVGVNYAIVDKGSEAVHEKNGQHCSFGITGVVAADQDCNYTDKESVDIFTRISAAGSDRVSGHEHDCDHESSEAELLDGGEEAYGIEV